MKPRYAAILITVLPLLAGNTGFDERYYYRLTNSYLGDTYSLDSTASDKLVAAHGKILEQLGPILEIHGMGQWLLPIVQRASGC